MAVFTGAAGGKTFQTAAFEWSSIVRRTFRRAKPRRTAPFHAARGFTERIFSRGRKRPRRERARPLSLSLSLLFLHFIFIGKFVVNLSRLSFIAAAAAA